jgi:hypothetical protein
METPDQTTNIQTPSAPPEEALKMDFHFNPSLLEPDDSSDTVITNSRGEKIEETKPSIKEEEEPTKKEESKKEAKVETIPILKPPKEEKKAETTPSLPVEKKEPDVSTRMGLKPIGLPEKKGETDAFDYSGFSPQEVINLKNMSRQSREYTSGLIKERRELEKLKDSSYLQHEDAYTLSPEYHSIRTKVINGRSEAQAWKAALIAIKEGRPFVEPIDRDPKTGALIYGKERQATSEDEIRISQSLQTCINYEQAALGELNQFPDRFKKQIQQDSSTIEQVRKQQFAWQADPKLLDYSVTTDQGEKTIKQLIGDFKNMFPPYHQNQIGVAIAADLMVALVIRTAELNEAQKGRGVAEIKSIEAARGEPSSSNAESDLGNSINKKGVPKTFSLSGSPFDGRD